MDKDDHAPLLSWRNVAASFEKAPIWVPPVIAAFCIFLLWDPEFYFNNFGPNSDLVNTIAASGQFQPRSSTKTPYLFRRQSGEIIKIYCAPRSPINNCLNAFPINDGSCSIIYAPFRKNIWNNRGGVILGLKNSGNDYLNVNQQKVYIASYQNPSIGSRIFMFALHALGFSLFGVCFYLLAIGNIVSLKKIIN